MHSLDEFLSMGGYAAYVWPAYAVAAVVVLANCISPLRRLRRLKEEIRRQGRTAP